MWNKEHFLVYWKEKKNILINISWLNCNFPHNHIWWLVKGLPRMVEKIQTKALKLYFFVMLKLYVQVFKRLCGLWIKSRQQDQEYDSDLDLDYVYDCVYDHVYDCEYLILILPESKSISHIMDGSSPSIGVRPPGQIRTIL